MTRPADVPMMRSRCGTRSATREALLLPIIANGEAIGSDTLDAAVAANHARQALNNLPADLSRLDDGGTGYDVRISEAVT